MPAYSTILIDISRTGFTDMEVIQILVEFQAHTHLKTIRLTLQKSSCNPMHELVQKNGSGVR